MSSVLVDTCIWSLALRRNEPGDHHLTQKLANLIRDHRALMVGPIRQELLSGYSDLDRFETLRSKLAPFDNFPIQSSDYETAARFSNLCRRRGIQGSPVDFLICAVAYRAKSPIFTVDQDFEHFAQHLDISLFPTAP